VWCDIDAFCLVQTKESSICFGEIGCLKPSNLPNLKIGFGSRKLPENSLTDFVFAKTNKNFLIDRTKYSPFSKI